VPVVSVLNIKKEQIFSYTHFYSLIFFISRKYEFQLQMKHIIGIHKTSETLNSDDDFS
jgi:hypothetical protein